jgi:hypothetical protein
MKNTVFWDVTPFGSCKNRVSEERSASIIRVTRIGELATWAETSNRYRLRRWKRYVPPKRRFFQEPHGVTSQKTAFLIFKLPIGAAMLLWLWILLQIPKAQGWNFDPEIGVKQDWVHFLLVTTGPIQPQRHKKLEYGSFLFNSETSIFSSGAYKRTNANICNNHFVQFCIDAKLGLWH